MVFLYHFGSLRLPSAYLVVNLVWCVSGVWFEMYCTMQPAGAWLPALPLEQGMF